MIILSTLISQRMMDLDERSEAGETLQAILNATQQAAHTWANENMAIARLWATDSRIVQFTQQLLAVKPVQKELLAADIQTKVRERLAVVLHTVHYQGFFIISPQGINLSSNRDDNVGVSSLLLDQSEFMNKLWSGQTAISAPQRSDVPLPDAGGMLVDGMPTMFAGAPIRTGPDSQVIAVLVFRINPAVDFFNIFKGGRFRGSGEIYAFNQQGLLLTESRFVDTLRNSGQIGADESALLNIRITVPGNEQRLTRMAASAVHGESGMDLHGYPDYRGVPVIGAWRWDSELGLGIAVEADVDEAFYVLKIAHFSSAFVALVSIVAVIGLSYMLMRKRRKLEDSEERFRTVFESAQSGFSIRKLTGELVDVNPAMYKMLGYSKKEFARLPLTALVREEDQYLLERFMKTLAAGKIFRDHGVVLHKDGHPLHVETMAVPFLYRGKPHIFNSLLDRSEQQRMLESLRRSEERFRALFESAVDGIVTIDEHSIISLVNPAIENIFGYRAADLIGKSVAILMPESERRLHDEAIQRYLSTGEGTVIGKGVIEETARRSDGSVFPIGMSIGEFFEGDRRYFVANIRDISAQKQVEAELANSREQLRKLGSYLEKGREEFRKRLAREVHDELGQALMALNLDLHWISQRMTKGNGAVRGKISAMTELINDTVKCVQRISSELRPAMLDELGLAEACRWYISNIEQRSAMRCYLDLSLDESCLLDEQRIALYRILQEALTNILRHAEATEVEILLKSDEHWIVLRVSDNGIGIDENVIAKDTSLGLLGMRERVAVLGGRIEIRRRPCGGTQLEIELPVMDNVARLNAGGYEAVNR